MSSSDDDNVEIYIRPDGKKVRKIKKKVLRSKSSESLGSASDSGGESTGSNDSTTRTEVYTRPDGKKVRRVVRRTVSAAVTPASTTSITNGDTASTISESTPPQPSTTPPPPSEQPDAEIIIRPDGKKVRRVRKTVKRSVSAAPAVQSTTTSSVVSDTSVTSVATSLSAPSVTSTNNNNNNNNGTAKSGLSNFIDNKNSTSDDEKGEVYINKDGKKVRRIRRGVSRNVSEAAATVNSNATGGNNSGENTDTGEVYRNAEGKLVRRVKKSKTISEGEIYIRPDGKKVRRVKRSSSSLTRVGGGTAAPTAAAAVTMSPSKSASASANTLNGFLEKQQQQDKPHAGELSGSATVAGEKIVQKIDGGEIYINKDGKKVRRVRKQKKSTTTNSSNDTVSSADDSVTTKESTSSITKPTSTATEDNNNNTIKPSLSNDSTSTKDSQPRSVARSMSVRESTETDGSTVATGDDQSSPKNSSNNKEVEGEIYINKDGKKVRRVRRSSTMTPQQKLDNSNSEIYIRPDGKKVRRVRRTKSEAPTTTASTAITTPGGKQLPPDCEIVVRPDGKKVIRRRKSKKNLNAAAVDNSNDEKQQDDGTEVYRRADGKLVRRVRRAKSSAAAITGGGSTAATTTTSTTRVKSTPTTTTTIEEEEDKKPAAKVIPDKATTSTTVTKRNIITLTDEEGTIASQYRKMLKMGLPEGAVRHKMITSDVHPKIIASVLGEEYNEKVKEDEKKEEHNDDNEKLLPISNIKLTGGEEAIATQFRKMLKMGLPEDAVRHKMAVSNTEPKIIAAVFGEEWTEPEPTPAAIVTPPPPPVAVVPQQPPAPTSSKIKLSDEEDEIADEFRKMLKLGMPEGAVRHKMAATDTHPKIIAAVFNEEWNDEPEPEKPIPAAVTETPTTTKSTIQLSATEDEEANGFRKMLKMGMPEGAVRHRMAASGTHPKIIAAVFGEEWNEPEPEKPAAEAPPPTMSSGSSIQLSATEDEEANEFRKMLKMGMPEGAVRHRMAASGTHPKIIAAVFDEEWNEPEKQAAPTAPSGIQLSPEEDATADEFRKMLKMGLPEGAVRHKMAASGAHPKIIAAVFGEEWNEPEPPAAPPAGGIQLSPEEDATAEPFRKMLNMGIPEGAVRHKMAASGVHAKIVASVFGEEWNEAPSTPAPPTAEVTTSSQPASGSILSAEEEAIAGQFRKMLKMGLPNDAVRHKMILSEVDPQIIAAVLGEDDVSTPKESTAQSSLSSEEESIAAQYRRMQKAGIPDDAVRHKMVLNEIDPKIIAAVFGEKAPDQQSLQSPNQLTPEEEAVAAQYRKMQKMGLPDDAVRHKMVVSEVDPKIIAAVFNEKGNIQQASSDTQFKAPDGVAYMVVVGDEPIEQSTPQQDDSTIDLDPNEKFAVKVADHDSPSKQTKFLTLSELSKITGQNKEHLESLVSEKRKRGASPPRFTLQPLNQEQKFAVSLPPQQSGATSSLPPNAQNVKEVKEGQEVVDSELASAARAVSALGAGGMEALLAKLQEGDMKELLEKLAEAEKRQKKLEKQLAQAGVAIAEDIEYQEAKRKVEEIAKRMGEIGGSDVTVADKAEQNKLREEYFKLEQEMERYNTALMLTEEYQAEQDRIERKWEADNEPDNIEALKKIRRHMPVNIRHLSEADLTTKPSPNGKYLPKAIAKKFKRTNILQCLRISPDDLVSMHPATLENMRVTGMTLTERRAIYHHFRPIGPKWEKNKAEKMTERKWTWYQMMKNNFKENLAPYLRHVEQYGPPGNHPYATRDNPNAGCPLIGKQCPIKADKLMDYDGDYGWTDEAVYEVSEVRKAQVEDSGAKAMAEALELAKEKKANERADLLKKHYKGKLLQVSKANGSCEAMDESMDNMENHTIRWIEFILDKGEDEAEADKKKEVANFTDALNEFKLRVIDFCQRSGMQMSGAKKPGSENPDIRSSIEASLAEEVIECSKEFFKFIRDRMKEINIHDTRSVKTIEMLEGMLEELHGRNLKVFENLGVKRSDRSRKLKTNKDLRKQVEDERKPKEEEQEAPAQESGGGMGPPPGGAGRGGLLDAIAGAGRGRGGGGRGGLLDAIAGAGRGRGRGGGGRGGLLDAIQGAGRGRGRGGGGGRGDLLSAIAGRGKKGGDDGGGGGGGGRGDLLAAIAGRGRGKKPGGDAGGRGGLLAAIAARGGGGD